MFIQMNFIGDPLSKTQAQQLAHSFYSSIECGMELVLGMFGIGKTGVIICDNGI